jgi:molybdenum cofactor guanylyltransferase
MTGAHAVLLAGGAGSRLGGTDKALLEHAGRTLLGHWTAALAERGVSGVVVGPQHLNRHLTPHLRLTREDPPLSGPAAAVCAGVRALPPADPEDARAAVLLLAVDMVNPRPLLDWLLDWLPVLHRTGEEAVVPRDAEGRFQMLSSAVSRAWLQQRVDRLLPGQEVGQSLRWLLSGAHTAHPVLPDDLGGDVDTPDDARRLSINYSPELPGGGPQ